MTRPRSLLAVAACLLALAGCGGSHYVWDDYVGGYVFRPYSYAC